jgi:UDP-glucose 4-epimerase
MNKKGRVLVTGATGFIGSHTIVELVEAGYDVVGVDNFSNSTRDVLLGIKDILGEDIPFVEVDCCDLGAFKRVFEKYPDIMYAIHFAAYKAVGESVANPLKYYKNNLLSLLNLVELLSAKRGSSIVFSSSCTVYGDPEDKDLPVSEDAPMQPATSPYGSTKQICEGVLTDAVKAKIGLNVVSLRYFNPIGAHPSAKIGELSVGVPQNLVPYITQTAAGIRESLSIFGDDYDTPDGTCIRDYIYVCDLAKAHVAAVDMVRKRGGEDHFDVFNLGTGVGLSTLQLVKCFIHSTGVNLKYKFAPRRVGDVVKVWANPEKANQQLHWRAATPIEEVLCSAWNWEKKLRGIK